jgi:hypothetical protein
MIHNFDRLPVCNVAIPAFAENPVEHAGSAQQAVSAFLKKNQVGCCGD